MNKLQTVLSLALTGFLAVSLPCAAETSDAWPPAAGKPVDVSRTVILFRDAPDSCVYIPLAKVSVKLPYTQLARDSWRTEAPVNPDRAAALKRESAENILSNTGENPGASGCFEMKDKQAISASTSDIATYLREGLAYVRNSDETKQIEKIQVRYLADNVMGSIMYYVPDEEQPVMFQSWWVR